MASNKNVFSRKIKNFVRSKCYPGDISKDKGKKANFRKSFKNFKIADGHLGYKRKRRVIFDNDKKLLIPQYQSTFTVTQYSFKNFELQTK